MFAANALRMLNSRMTIPMFARPHIVLEQKICWLEWFSKYSHKVNKVHLMPSVIFMKSWRYIRNDSNNIEQQNVVRRNVIMNTWRHLVRLFVRIVWSFYRIPILYVYHQKLEKIRKSENFRVTNTDRNIPLGERFVVYETGPK